MYHGCKFIYFSWFACVVIFVLGAIKVYQDNQVVQNYMEHRQSSGHIQGHLALLNMPFVSCTIFWRFINIM
jgi:uncharacterized membrane protein YraQ (UPF0718 family)